MRIETKIFGTVEITDDKIITFENGIIGFPELKHFTLLHDDEAGTDAGIRFLQSMQEPGFAMPVMDPLIVKQDYDPVVEDELLAGIGELNENNLLVMVTVTVPSDLTKMRVILQGPIIINVEKRLAVQLIVENKDYPVKYPIYDIRKSGKDGE